MKYILVDKDKVIKAISNNIEVKSDRYLLVEERVEIFKDYPTQDIEGNVEHNYINVYQVEVPENIVTEKYCYDETNGFYKNENYVEYYSEEDRISALEDMVNMLILGGNE